MSTHLSYSCLIFKKKNLGHLFNRITFVAGLIISSKIYRKYIYEKTGNIFSANLPLCLRTIVHDAIDRSLVVGLSDLGLQAVTCLLGIS